MAKVLIFNNFLKKGQSFALVPDNSIHEYQCTGPGRLQANPYSKSKHIGPIDLIKRLLVSLVVFLKSRKYDVLVLDSAITAMLTAPLLKFRKKQKVIISDFNVPRRRKNLWKTLSKFLFKRINVFLVHSRYDIELASKLYNIPQEQFTFLPYARKQPCSGKPDSRYLFDDNRPYILSLGGNARDYSTLFKAAQQTQLNIIVVARQYNLRNLTVPRNVRTFCNIALEQCDKLVSQCLFTVFTFDGTEPSSGQISIVTSFMLGKPTICTDIIGVRDYVKDGLNGLLVKMGDAEDVREKMLMLSNDRKLYSLLCSGVNTWVAENAKTRLLQQKFDKLISKTLAQSS